MAENTQRQSERSRPKCEAEDKLQFGKNIEKARMSRGFSRPQLAKELGITLGGVSAWEYGRTRPDLNSLKRLCEVLRVSCDELLGVEPRENRISEEELHFLNDYRRLPDNEKRYIEGMIKMMRDNAKYIPTLTIEKPKARPKLISLPLNPLSMCAGDGTILDYDGETEYIQLIENDMLLDCDELVKVSGRSMEPEFYDGDLALVKHTDSLSEGDIGVFVINGEGMLKQYRKDGLHPLNPAYSVIKPDPYSSFRCFGKVI